MRLGNTPICSCAIDVAGPARVVYFGGGERRTVVPKEGFTRTTLVALVLVTIGCSHEITGAGAPGRCMAMAPTAVIVAVNDSVSGASVVDSARGVAKLGTEVDSLWLSAPPPRLLGGTKLGTYQVSIDRPGYREWIKSNVVVSHQGECGNTIPVQLTALMQRAP
jgi:hypothetical protein